MAVNPSLMRLKMKDLILQSKIYFKHGPRDELHRLIARLDNKQLDVYEDIVDVEKAYFKKTDLTKLNKDHEKMRALWDLYYCAHYLHYKEHRKQLSDTEALRRFTCINTMVDELGKMIGAWIKHETDKSAA